MPYDTTLFSDYGSNASNASNGEGLLVTFTEGVREHYLKCLEQSVSSVKQVKCKLLTSLQV